MRVTALAVVVIMFGMTMMMPTMPMILVPVNMRMIVVMDVKMLTGSRCTQHEFMGMSCSLGVVMLKDRSKRTLRNLSSDVGQ